jgi:hypothetical protein
LTAKSDDTLTHICVHACQPRISAGAGAIDKYPQRYIPFLSRFCHVYEFQIILSGPAEAKNPCSDPIRFIGFAASESRT